MRNAIAVGFLFVAITGTFARAEADGSYLIWQSTECREWVAARKRGSAATMEAWVTGFLTGYNVSRSESGKGQRPSVTTVYAYLDDRCARDPSEKLRDATLAYVGVDTG